MSYWRKANEWLAVKSNVVFASMELFWILLIFCTIPLVWPSTLSVVQFVSSGVFQAVALPLIAVGTVIAAKSSDKLAVEQHQATMESHEEIKKLLAEDDAIEARLQKIEDLLTRHFQLKNEIL